MTPRAEGRHCARCERTVIDMTRVTREQAEAIARAHGGKVCGRVRANERGEAVFAAEPVRRGVVPVALAGLLAACSAQPPEPDTTDAPTSDTEPVLSAAPTVATFGGSLATGVMLPMGPPAPAPAPAPAPCVVSSVDDTPVVPTAEQRALTRRKHQPRHVSYPPPRVRPMMGDMYFPDPL